MQRRLPIVLILLSLASLLLPAEGRAAIDKATVEAAWSRIAAAGDMRDVPLFYEKDETPNTWVKFEILPVMKSCLSM